MKHEKIENLNDSFVLPSSPLEVLDMYVMKDIHKESPFYHLPQVGCYELHGHFLTHTHLVLMGRCLHGFLEDWGGPFCPLQEKFKV